MQIALTRKLSSSFERCQLTHLDRQPIDMALARKQHASYERMLAGLGCEIVQLPEEPELPDAVFIEDTAVMLDEAAVIARPGALSRRAEIRTVSKALQEYRLLLPIEAPATLDGGDVLKMDRTLYVGLSSRTNTHAIDQLKRLLLPFGYQVIAIPVTGCLHLKSAVCQVGENSLLLNPGWIDASGFEHFQQVEVDPAEPMAANALLLGDTLIYPQAFPETQKRLEAAGCRIQELDISEISKAEGGVTCCSVIFNHPF